MMIKRSGMRLSATVALVLAVGLLAMPAGAQQENTPPGYALRVAKVVSFDDAERVINNAVVLVRGTAIEAVGPVDEVEIPADFVVREFPQYWLVPGLTDPHNHSAAGGWFDLNDMVYQANPGLDTRSVPRADNPWILQARTGGVTTVIMIPGSGTNMSGFGTLVDTAGRDPDEMLIRSPGSLKIAQAGNPEWYFGGNGRMFMNWNTRQTLQKARLYHESWSRFEQGAGPQPAFDPTWAGFRELFTREMPVTMHTQMYQVLMATMDNMYDRFDFWTVLDHCTFDAWKLGPVVAQSDAWAINGPRQYHYDRTARRMIGNASGWWKNGVRRLGINTDAPVIPQEELSYQAAMACWYGWLPYHALRGITRINAESLGLGATHGTIEPRKQADLTIWSGDPLDPRSACLLTMVKGRIIYDGTTETARRF